MSNDPNGADDNTDVIEDIEEDEEFRDVEADLEEAEIEAEAETSYREKAGEYWDSFKGFWTSDPEDERWSKKPAVGDTRLNRRGFITGAALVGAGAYGAFALDDDDGAVGGGEVPPEVGERDGNGNGNGAAADIERAGEYAWETEQALLDATGLCYAQPNEEFNENYLGAVDADQVEELLSEEQVNGRNPTGALSVEEVDQDLGDITPHQGLYVIDIDRKQGNDGDHDYFVQLVGQEDGGTYVTRGGAMEVSDLPFEEIFEYTQCN